MNCSKGMKRYALRVGAETGAGRSKEKQEVEARQEGGAKTERLGYAVECKLEVQSSLECL